ncbi:hypothetical protein [Streptomyces klenkii]
MARSDPALRENAVAEGVHEHVRLCTVGMAALPSPAPASTTR